MSFDVSIDNRANCVVPRGNIPMFVGGRPAGIPRTRSRSFVFVGQIGVQIVVEVVVIQAKV